MKKMKLLLAAALLLAMLLPMTACAYTRYVKTNNSWYVHVRAEPSVDAERWSDVRFGTQVDVLETQNGWSLCDIPGFSNPGWISSKYLSKTYPGDTPAGKRDTPVEEPDTAALSFRGFYAVNHYEVVVAHQTSAFLNLRWAPSESEAIIRRCYNGTELTVYAESSGWYQVYDPQSGFCGFMRPKYLQAIN